MRLTATEKNIARAFGLMVGILAILSVLWVSRPVAQDPAMGTELTVRVQPMDGIDLTSAGATVVKKTELKAGSSAAEGVVRLTSVHPYQSKLRWNLDQTTIDTIRRHPTLGQVWIRLGAQGEFGQVPISVFAQGATPTAWVPSGQFEVPVTIWIPASSEFSVAALELDLNLVPEIVGMRP